MLFRRDRVAIVLPNFWPDELAGIGSGKLAMVKSKLLYTKLPSARTLLKTTRDIYYNIKVFLIEAIDLKKIHAYVIGLEFLEMCHINLL